MEIRRLRHFLAVITHGSFTAAARAELIVQSALSTSVRNLERVPGPPAGEGGAHPDQGPRRRAIHGLPGRDRSVVLAGRAPRPRNPAAVALLERLARDGS
ncbi:MULTISPECIES: LysR family transcriptional regulator [unclassified Streptomyces]|uniref:helix-turn-helix domain-containing protein n=1 Tax=unclassified Streptomyces TaxID=2593676 RepID=UPI001F156218|nr:MULTISPECIES: LysR family transcriptional regulator [unclassified Streptomyces]MCX4773587.1 LysR family transcriptional regulator [Streptomyces sp. NBC_01285]